VTAEAAAWGTSVTPDEWAAIREGYDRLMGPGRLDDIFQFVPFMYRIRPDALKRYRLFVDTVTQGRGLEDGMPNPPVASLVSGHFYVTLPYPDGVLGDLFVASRINGTKQEVADILALSFLHSGPFGMNVIAHECQADLDRWVEGDNATGITWPEGWNIDASAFQCGIDFEAVVDDTDLSGREYDLIEAWHLKVQGEVPAYVTFLGAHFPRALRAFRARYETSTGGQLPRQFIALCHVHLSACWGQTGSLRRSLRMARHFGVSKDHAVQIMALAMLYLGDVAMDSAVTDANEILADWPESSQQA
jgi:alkylhydroperoxidase/carboxymuconolactone decarboxylase family protein YurZ